MGLDMFIFKHKRFEDATLSDVMAVDSYLELVQYKKEHPECKSTMEEWCGRSKPANNLIKFFGKDWTKDGGRSYEEVAYWRKANMVHKWFVEHVQDGEDDCDIHRELTRQDLLDLLGEVVVVLRDPTMAEKLLPTQPGFFFGEYEYDDYYLSKLYSTVEQIGRILVTTDWENEALYYVSSW